MTRAQSFLSGGDTFAPSHVYFAGIAPWFAKAELDSVIVEAGAAARCSGAFEQATAARRSARTMRTAGLYNPP